MGRSVVGKLMCIFKSRDQAEAGVEGPCGSQDNNVLCTLHHFLKTLVKAISMSAQQVN